MHLTLTGEDRVLRYAVGASILFHAVLLSIHFKLPEALRWNSSNQPLEVVLVNAKSRERPSKADVLAQANLDRGGNVDERRHAKTPLPVTEPKNPGKDLAAAQRRVQQLEAQQQRLLAQARESQAQASAPRTAEAQPESPAAQPNGRDLADLALAAMRLQAQIDKQVEEYQKRPRKKFIGANAREYRFARYEEDWRAKIERVGEFNYPAEARGKVYGTLRLTVCIQRDGTLCEGKRPGEEPYIFERKSGSEVLDRAAEKILRLSVPFAPFPADIRGDTDLLYITRTWFFGQGDKLWTE
jgi:protein TonB